MRYARQERFIGAEKQKALSKSLVVIIGCGGTGSAAANYLARAGVSLRLIDRDIVELSNIQRQLFKESDVGRPKAEALKESLEEANSSVAIDAVSDDLNQHNIDELLSGASVILDGTDNMGTRFLLNDYCLKNRIPFSYAASIKSEGLMTFILPKKTPCLRCFVPSSSAGKLDTCETAGVLGPVAGIIGILSAAEAIKHIIGETTIAGNLLHINIYNNLYETVSLEFGKKCLACEGTYEFLNGQRSTVSMLCGGTYQYLFDSNVNPSAVMARLKDEKNFSLISNSRGIARFSYGDYNISLFRNRMLIQNIFSERAVKTVAARLVGL